MLENTNNILNKIKNVKDKEKNLVDVYKIINYSIEDSNILIHLEGIKLLENICRLFKNFINIQKLKLLLETSFDKLKDKKSLVKNELFTLFNMIIENHCFEIDKFRSFILQFCTSQKKENAQVKMGLLEYIKILFLQQNNILCLEVKKIKEKDYYNFIKKIVLIIQKETLSFIKDLCSDLLIIFKKRVEDIDSFYDLIIDLPNYRKKIINEEGVGGVEEGEYKKNLKRIKSSYSFSKTKYTGGFRNKNKEESKHERSKSNIRLNNFERNKSSTNIHNSFSSNKINNNNKSKNTTRTNFKINQKTQTGYLPKDNKKKIPSNSNINNPKTSNKKKSINNNEKNNSSKDMKKRNNYSSGKKNKDNNNNINNKECDYNGVSNNKRNSAYNFDEIKNNNNKEEDFNEKKENLLENIHNLDINSIDKYSKVIIRDFLIFINKICNENQEKEDLSYHFNTIFTIFEKILYRLIVLLNENQEIKEKYIKLKKLLDELIGHISKVIILTPCIDQIKGTNKFDDCLLETFMEKIKEFCLNKEKFYMHLLLSLYKFCEKDDVFPKMLNPKPSVIYFLKYLKNGYLETKSERLLNILKEFISETKLLNMEEKKVLLIKDNVNNNNIQRNIDEPKQYEVNNKENINDKNKIYNEEGEEEEEENEEEIKYNNNNNNIKSTNDEDKNDQIINNKIKAAILDVNEDKINNVIPNNIALKLKLFQDKLNKIPPSQDKETEITENDKSQNNKMDIKNISEKSENYIDNNNNNIKPIDKDYLNDKNIKEEKDQDHMDNEKSKLNDNDLQKIEDSIRLMSKRLDNTLNKMNEVSQRNKNSRKLNIITNNSLSNKKGNINSLNNSNNNSMTISKISENNNASIITSESFLKNNLFNFNTNNNKEIIEQLISVIKGESNKNNIYQTAKSTFHKLSIEEKIEFTKILKNSLENPVFLSQIPINTCVNLFDFILSILSYQILNQSNNEQIIVNLQGIAEHLLSFRNLNDMFKIMLFLLRKYFPKNLNNKIEDLSLIMIKVISYLLKELLKRLNNENVIGKDIICEINDLFTVTSPSSLTTATPNALFYQHIFTLLKSITDQIVFHNKNELINIIQYLQENKIVCEDYIQYLIKLQKAH